MTDSVVQKVQRGETSRRSGSRSKGAVCLQFTDKDGEEKRAKIRRDIDPRVFDAAVTVSEPDARAYEDQLPEHPLPGTGETRDTCGRPLDGLGCTDCWALKEVGQTCRSPDCPRCNTSWKFHRGIEKGVKLHDLAKKVNHQTFKHHLTVSLRESTRFNSKYPLKKAREAIKPLLCKVNVDTGYLVYHGFRIKKEYRGDVLGYKSGEGDIGWKDITEKLESEAWSWEVVKEEFLVYAPHFHVLCLSDFVDTTDVGEIEEKTGVVIHRITSEQEDGKERSIADVDELCRALGYSLTHTGIAPESERQTHRADTWAFGQVANHDVGKQNPSRMEVDAAMRRVAPKILGASFPKHECDEMVSGKCDHDDHGHDFIGAGAEDLRSTSVGSSSESHSVSVSDDRETWDANGCCAVGP